MCACAHKWNQSVDCAFGREIGRLSTNKQALHCQRVATELKKFGLQSHSRAGEKVRKLPAVNERSKYACICVAVSLSDAEKRAGSTHNGALLTATTETHFSETKIKKKTNKKRLNFSVVIFVVVNIVCAACKRRSADRKRVCKIKQKKKQWLEAYASHHKASLALARIL